MEGKGEKPNVSSTDRPECAVCLQPCVQPVQLPCRHIFCYLCVKGVTHRSKRCAMCRQEIPANYLDNPVLVQTPPSNTTSQDDHQWFYEGRNGWWQYDERTSSEIETAYQKGEKQCEVLIAGFLYVIDFDENHQYRRSDPFRQRRVKRDLSSIPKKGIAGIRIVADPVEEQGAHGSDTVQTDEDNSTNPGETSSPETENTPSSNDHSNAAVICDSELDGNLADVNTPERTTHEVDCTEEERYNTRSSGRKK